MGISKIHPENPLMLICSKLYSLIYQLLNHNIKLGTSETKFFFSPYESNKIRKQKEHQHQRTKRECGILLLNYEKCCRYLKL